MAAEGSLATAISSLGTGGLGGQGGITPLGTYAAEADLLAEVSRASAAENTLASQLAAESSRAMASESAIISNTTSIEDGTTQYATSDLAQAALASALSSEASTVPGSSVIGNALVYPNGSKQYSVGYIVDGIIGSIGTGTVYGADIPFEYLVSNGTYLYAFPLVSYTYITQYQINPTDGSLSHLTPPTVDMTNSNQGTLREVCMHPTGSVIYTLVGITGLNNFYGTFYGLPGIQQYTVGTDGQLSLSSTWINPTTVHLSANTSLDISTNEMLGMCVHPSGKYLYGFVMNLYSGLNAILEYDIDPVTSLVVNTTPRVTISGQTSNRFGTKLVMNPTGLCMYLFNGVSVSTSMYPIFLDATTGAVTQFGTYHDFSASLRSGSGVPEVSVGITPNAQFMYVS